MEINKYTPYRLSLFYFIFFAWMGIHLPYFNLYLYYINISPFQIAIITASVPLVRIISPAFWGYIADRHDQRGVTGRVLWIMSSLSFSTLFFVEQFEYLLLIVVVFTFFWSPTLPLAEAATMMTVRRVGIDYGRIRVWGTVGFILFSWLMGVALDIFPMSLLLSSLVVLLIISTYLSFHIPSKRGGSAKISLKSAFKELSKKETLIFLTVAMLMLFSHATYYGFFSIYLEEIGFSKSMIGLLWALGPAGEILIMIYADQIIRKYDLFRVLIFSLLMAFLRWGILASTDSIYLLIPAQLLHAFSFGTFHIASVRYIEKLFPDAMKNTAQALYSSSSYGVGLVIGTLISGYLYADMGAPFLFGISSLAVLLALIMLFQQNFSGGSNIEVPD